MQEQVDKQWMVDLRRRLDAVGIREPARSTWDGSGWFEGVCDTTRAAACLAAALAKTATVKLDGRSVFSDASIDDYCAACAACGESNDDGSASGRIIETARARSIANSKWWSKEFYRSGLLSFTRYEGSFVVQIAEGNCRDRFGVTRKAYNWAIASAADPAPKWLWDSDTGEILDGIVAASGSSWDLADAKRLAVAATKEKS